MNIRRYIDMAIRREIRHIDYDGTDLYYDLKDLERQFPSWRQAEVNRLHEAHTAYANNITRTTTQKYLSQIDKFIEGEKSLHKQAIEKAKRMKAYLQKWV